MGPEPNPPLLVRFYAREIYTCSPFSCGVDFVLKDVSILLELFNNFVRFVWREGLFRFFLNSDLSRMKVK